MGRQIASTAVSGAVLLLFLPLLAVAHLAFSAAASEGPGGSMVASVLVLANLRPRWI